MLLPMMLLEHLIYKDVMIQSVANTYLRQDQGKVQEYRKHKHRLVERPTCVIVKRGRHRELFQWDF